MMETVKITTIKPNPSNPRVIKDEKFLKLVKSIQDFPEMLSIRPIVVNDDMVVLGGNMRLKACKEAGLKEIPIIKASALSEDKQREFIIKDNVGFGEWDWNMLANDWDVEQLTDWGLDIPDFAVAPEAEEDDFEMPETVETDIVLGDLFEIGEHRLLCGSSTEADAVGKLLNGKEPYLMVTDPPYGVEYDPQWRKDVAVESKKSSFVNLGKVSNDDVSDWSEAWSLSPAKVAYVYHSAKYASTVQASLEQCEFIIRSQIIWDKGYGIMSRGDYNWQHEPCWYAVKKNNKGNWAGDKKQTTVWRILPLNSYSNKEEKVGHGTQKPVECMAKAIGNHDGDVYDPFLGSGTTMVAAHQLKRKCFGMELDPKYVQIIVDRMRKLDPSLKITKNGQPYAIQEAVS